MNNELLARSGLSLERLAAFLGVAEAGSIVKAAGGDASRQSLASRQIRELEEYFGVELVRRKGRGLVLTEQGRQLASLIRQQFTALHDFHAGAVSQPVVYSLGAQNALLNWLAIPRLAAIKTALPHIYWQFRHESNRELVDKLMMGECDFGLVRKDVLAPSLAHHVLGTLQWRLYVPQALGAISGECKNLGRELKNLPLILPLGGHIREGMEGLAQQLRTTLDIRYECTSHTQALEAVRAGAAAAVLPEITASYMSSSAVQCIPLPPRHFPHWALCLAYSRRLASVRPHANTVAKALQSILAL